MDLRASNLGHWTMPGAMRNGSGAMRKSHSTVFESSDPLVYIKPPRSTLRRFKSRHVPAVAEEVHHGDDENRQRFCGLLAHLRDNKVHQEEEDQILTVGVGIVHEDVRILHDIFAHYCNIAERMNTEMLSVTKFDKLLEDVIKTHGLPSKCRNLRTVIFYRVMHVTEPPSTRLDFEGFCKSLGILAMRMYPKLDTQAALDCLVQLIISAAYVLMPPRDDSVESDMAQLCADGEGYAKILQVIKKYEHPLKEIFARFCGKNAVPGEALDAGGTLGSVLVQKKQFHTFAKAKTNSALEDGFLDGSTLEGFSPASSTRSSVRLRLHDGGDKLDYAGIVFDMRNCDDKPDNTLTDGLLHGVPTVKGWQRLLNFHQWRCLWKDLGVYPHICTNRLLASVFKQSNDAHSAYGFLSHAAFIEAVIRLAVECYSDSPYKEEFLTVDERVNGFLRRVMGSLRGTSLGASLTTIRSL
eukprot:GEMP01035488.1.p1 GENE.GEMP01035488.1~~GEMP01035488.1.p1  ORF type:complete len:467 (+),score=79.13 GEMP01035488.1:178-1578(+)